MKEYVNGFWGGYSVGWKYNMRRIKESKWYIIPVVINTILSPLIVLIALLMCLTEVGRKLVFTVGMDILEDED